MQPRPGSPAAPISWPTPRTAKPAVILIGTGSEVSLCVAAHEQLAREGIAARVVSMPSWELFEQQDQAYRDRILPPDITARVSVEMGSVIGWDRYAGATGAKVGMRTFGSSAPLKDLLAKFGFTAENVLAAAKRSDRDVQRKARMNPQANRHPQDQAKRRGQIRSRPCTNTGRPLGSTSWRAASSPTASLKKLVEQDGLTGVTSNPSIFEKAIGGSAEYDSALKEIASRRRRRCDDGSMSGWRSRTSGMPPTCCARSSRRPRGRTGMSASRSRPIWR